MESLWEQDVSLPRFDPLSQDRKTDVLIIGGGLTGILCAYQMHQAGIPYILVEAKTLCSGITKNTTAKITSQHGLIYSKIIREFGPDYAKQYLDANQMALNQYSSLCRHIDCDFQEQDSFVYSRNHPQKIEQELAALEQLHAPANFSTALPLPFPVAGGIRFPRQAQLNPLKLAAALVKDLHIYEHTPVDVLSGTTAITKHGKITARQVIVATHFPFLNQHGSYFLKMYQHRSYVLALRHASIQTGMYVDESLTGLSFRTQGSFLLLGGGGHRTGKPGGGWQELRETAKQYYPDAAEVCHWATQDCMTLDGIPYIGHYSANTPSLFVATGFNKWGMTSSMVSAMVLLDLVQGKPNPYASLFSPSRTILRPQLAINAWESAIHLLTPAAKRRCSHLGCALTWNSQEHTWDCPCHGSRFTKAGRRIDNPATKNLKR